MERLELEVYSQASNYGIVRMPGRSYPGCVIQGDSLSILVRRARALQQRVANSNDEELVDDAADLYESLLDRLLHYQEVLTEHGLDLPFTRIESTPP